RYGGVQTPKIEVIDLRQDYKKRQMAGHFSKRLIDQIRDVLDDGQKVILFQNRRGFAPVILCTNCGHTEHCVNCDINLTYHKGLDTLRCHYCGYSAKPRKTCSQCGSTELT